MFSGLDFSTVQIFQLTLFINVPVFWNLFSVYDKNGTFHDTVKNSKHKAVHISSKTIDDESKLHSVNKRQAVSCPVKYIELWVAIDKDMVDYHGPQYVIPYTLTLMNIVSMLMLLDVNSHNLLF